MHVAVLVLVFLIVFGITVDGAAKAIWLTLKWVIAPVVGVVVGGWLIFEVLTSKETWAMALVFAFDGALLLYGGYILVYYCLIKMGLAKPATPKAD